MQHNGKRKKLPKITKKKGTRASCDTVQLSYRIKKPEKKTYLKSESQGEDERGRTAALNMR